MLSKDHIHTEYLLTFDMKSNKTELCGLSLVLLKEETPKRFSLLTPFCLLTSPFLFSYFTVFCKMGRFLEERITGRLVVFFLQINLQSLEDAQNLLDKYEKKRQNFPS